jgi:hypothetical protein
MSSLEQEPVHRTASAGFERPDWLDYEEFPFNNNAIEIDGNLIHYVDEGTGPTLLFIHAGPVWSFISRDVIEELRHNYRCIALDFPGSGLYVKRQVGNQLSRTDRVQTYRLGGPFRHRQRGQRESLR